MSKSEPLHTPQNPPISPPDQEIPPPAAKPLESFYPFPNFRPGALEAIQKIDAAVAAGKRFILCSANTGSGKSAISIAYARKFHSITLAPTKLLQQQYADTKEFEREFVVFGKANYKCGLDPLGLTQVDEAICCSDAVVKANLDRIPWKDDKSMWELDPKPSRALKKKCSATKTCPYYTLIDSIGRRPGAVLNYDLFVHIKPMKGRPHGAQMGDHLVMDEAHQLLSKVRSVFGFKMTGTTAQRVLGHEAQRLRNEDPLVWLKRLAKLAIRKLKGETDNKKAGSLDRFEKRISSVFEQDVEHPQKFHIDDTFEEVEIKPLDFRHLKGPIFYPFKHILMLSATFPQNFCELLGIGQDEVELIEIPSTFPAANRPALVVRGMDVLNHKTVLDERHPAKIALDLLLEKHKEDKGLIHCSNYKFFNQLKELYKTNFRFIWVDRDANKSEILDRHIASKIPTVLVSPSMTEGVDLKDELARFQVLLKLPYPTLDDYTKKMMGVFPGYYENQTATSIVQAYGRAVRSETDHATFYILDGAIGRLLNYGRLFPRYFTEALGQITLM